MLKVSKAVAAGVLALSALGVRTYFLHAGVASAERWFPVANPSASSLPHFDHAPRQGGLVLMNGDTHFEVLISRDGRYTVYFSDVVRQPLPPATASEVRVDLTQGGHPQEATFLDVDAGGGRWIGRGTPITDPNAVVRITYTAENKPYWIDVPVSAWNDAIASRPR